MGETLRDLSVQVGQHIHHVGRIHIFGDQILEPLGLFDLLPRHPDDFRERFTVALNHIECAIVPGTVTWNNLFYL
jgi:hypothetical protein